MITLPGLRTFLVSCLAALAVSGLGAAPAAKSTPGSTPSAKSPPASQASPAAAPTIAFTEVWAYLSQRETANYTPDLPVTDLAYFCASLNARGDLVGIPKHPGPAKPGGGDNAAAATPGVDPAATARPPLRRHLVFAETGNASLTHFVLAPEYPLRDRLVADLVKASQDWDGLQLDFEAVPEYDRDNFLAFVKLLKAALPGKILSLALPGRTKPSSEGFDYRSLGEVADRILVMAYDEHWSGSSAGPVASPDWVAKVADYACATIGPEKTILGIPFYGRIWADQGWATAYKFPSITQLRERMKAALKRGKDGIPTFSFSRTITYRAYFEDAASLTQRLELARAKHLDKVGFWRLGQEDKAVWKVIVVAAQPGAESKPASGDVPVVPGLTVPVAGADKP